MGAISVCFDMADNWQIDVYNNERVSFFFRTRQRDPRARTTVRSWTYRGRSQRNGTGSRHSGGHVSDRRTRRRTGNDRGRFERTGCGLQKPIRWVLRFDNLFFFFVLFIYSTISSSVPWHIYIPLHPWKCKFCLLLSV